MPKILVIGRGRCGTKAVALALQKMGLDVQHEAIGEDGSVNNEWALNVNGRPPLSSYTHVWHVVREPLANIASMHTFAWTIDEADRDWKPKKGQLTRPGGGPAPLMSLAQKYWGNLTARCAASYYEWNLECEQTLQEAAALGAHTWRFRIEDNWIPRAAILLFHPDTRAIAAAECVEIPANINSRRNAPTHPGQLSWGQVLADLDVNEKAGLLEMARRYGYDAPRMVIQGGTQKASNTEGPQEGPEGDARIQAGHAAQ